MRRSRLLLLALFAAGCSSGAGGSTGSAAGSDSSSSDASSATGEASSTSGVGDAGTGSSGLDASSGGVENSSGSDASSGSTGATQCPGLEEFDCQPCDVIVPDDTSAIGTAIATSPSPGQVCVRAGEYEESLTLRPHVAVRGAGPDTRIIGHVSLYSMSDADASPTRVSDMTLAGHRTTFTTCEVSSAPSCNGDNPDNEGRSISLEIERVVMVPVEAFATPYCLYYNPAGGSTHLVLRDSVCRAHRGLRLWGAPVDQESISIDILVERNRFEPGELVYISSPVDVLTSAIGSASADSTYDVVVRNNAFWRTWDEGVYVTGQPTWPANASVSVVHNTIVDNTNVGTWHHAIWHNTAPGYGPPLTVANNLYFGHQIALGGQPATLDVGNLLANQSPFVDATAGALQLLEGSAPIDAADPGWLDIDIDQSPRPTDGDGDGDALPDIGCYEYPDSTAAR